MLCSTKKYITLHSFESQLRVLEPMYYDIYQVNIMLVYRINEKFTKNYIFLNYKVLFLFLNAYYFCLYNMYNVLLIFIRFLTKAVKVLCIYIKRNGKPR